MSNNDERQVNSGHQLGGLDKPTSTTQDPANNKSNSPVQEILGYIHSIETGGTVDGPGLRYVLFLQGCPLRCLYCHNPDSWKLRAGKVQTVEQTFQDLLKYRNFIKSGGITVSGGEPLIQPEFLEALFQKCKAAGIHTAVDTSGVMPVGKIQQVLNLTDLVILDIKALDPGLCKKISGTDNKNALELLDHLEEQSKPVWIRHVVVPGYTDNLEDLAKLADYLKAYKWVQKVELLPFHQMALHKWESLKFPYTLQKVEPPTREFMTQAEALFLDRGLPL